MSDVVIKTKQEIDIMKTDIADQSHIKTDDIRKLSSGLYQSLKDKTPEGVYPLCEELLKERSWETSVIAYDWAYRMRKYYCIDTFSMFEAWLSEYVSGWGSCDDFCTHAFGELLYQYPELIDRIIPWVSRNKFWMRRAAAVILIPSIRKGAYDRLNPYHISDLLMTDEHDLVRKGYGWMLKVLSEKEPQKVYQYLLDNRKVMPRVAFRYALEKMDKQMKEELMELH